MAEAAPLVEREVGPAAAPMPLVRHLRRQETWTPAAGGICVTAGGTIVLSEPEANRLRWIEPDGRSTTAGGAAGFADGPRSVARFRRPLGVASLADGSVVVADAANHAVRRVDPDGNVTTLAGGANGLADGCGPEARFRYPGGVGVAGDGTIVVADTVNNAIRRVDPDGNVTTLAGGRYAAGGGSAGTSAFRSPTSVAVDPGGAIYVADTGNNRVCRVDPSGLVDLVTGGNPGGRIDGPPGRAELRWPECLVLLADGTVYVTDAGRDNLRRIAPDGTVTTQPGELGWHPVALARWAAGRLLVAEQRWSPAGSVGRLRTTMVPIDPTRGLAARVGR